MLHYLLVPLAEDFQIFNLFRYLTFRTGGTVLTALIMAFVIGPPLIRWLRSRQAQGQPIREDGPETHLLTKKGTPTMGGLLLLLCTTISTLLWADLTNRFVWAVLLVTIGYGGLGFIDDFLKISQKNSRGLPGKMKIAGQLAIGIIAAWWISRSMTPELSTTLALPFFKDVLIDLGWFFIPFALVVMVGASNAVNLTDGLDGLAIVPVMIAAGSFAFITYLIGNVNYANYLNIHFVAGSGELAVFLGALIGAGLGFLWFNAPPAMVFMGDTGALALGGALGAVSVVTKHELVLAIIGGLFVLEAVSVMIQVASFRLTGRRVFKMAPIHHHFEKMGWAEPTIVIRFWIIAVILALIGLSTLKLR